MLLSLKVVLMNANGAVVLASPSEIMVTINANDDSNGVLSLKTDDGIVFPTYYVNEDKEGQFYGFKVQRKGGTFGQISIAWQLVRNDSQIQTDPSTPDIEPMNGLLTFQEDVREMTIVLTIIQDSVPELAERYQLDLLAETITGGAKMGGVVSGELILEDSDYAYGVIQLADATEQTLNVVSISNLNFICGFIYQSVSDCSLLPHRYVHTSLNIKDVHLCYLDCSTVIIFNVSFISL